MNTIWREWKITYYEKNGIAHDGGVLTWNGIPPLFIDKQGVSFVSYSDGKDKIIYQQASSIDTIILEIIREWEVRG